MPPRRANGQRNSPWRTGERRRRRRGPARWFLLCRPSSLLLLFLLWLPLALLYGHVSEQELFPLRSPRGMSGAGEPRPAVRFRQLYYRWSRVSLLDVDLACPGVRVEVVAGDATPRRTGCSEGAARTVADWCRTTGALGGINGGFFGQERGAGRKEIVGLLKLGGKLYGRAPRYRERSVLGSPAPRVIPIPFYAHSALGFDRWGRPAIDWVVSDPHRPARLLAFERPTPLPVRMSGLEGAGLPWEIHSGLSGGPRLMARGRIAVSDRAERLASRGLLPRSFVAYALSPTPRYLVLGVATAMTFSDAARFLDGYFHRFHGVPCAEAMGLDGGPSSQLVYRAGGALCEAQASDVTVPTCLLVYADEAPSGV